MSKPQNMGYYKRYIYTQVGAMLITFALFLVMQGFLSSGFDVGHHDRSQPNFIRIKKAEEIQVKTPKPLQKPKKPVPAPAATPMETLPKPAFEAPVSHFDISDVVIKPSMSIQPGKGFGQREGTGRGGGDSDYLPLVKVPPMYPRKALRSGVEGYVVVAFTVTADGRVTHPRVIKAKPKGVFEQAAINAVLGFKYRPRTVNGKPMAVNNVQNKFTFKVKR